MYFKCSDLSEMPIEKESLLSAIETCKNNKDLQCYQSMIEAQFNKVYANNQS